MRLVYSSCSTTPALNYIRKTEQFLSNTEIASGASIGCPGTVRHSPALNKLYWTDTSAGRILRMNYDGSNVETVATIPSAAIGALAGETKLTGLTVDDDLDTVAVSTAAGTIYTMRRDGSQFTAFLTAPGAPLAGVGFLKHLRDDSRSMLYFCSGTQLFKVDPSLSNATIVTVANLTIGSSSSRGSCSGLSVEEFFGFKTLTVTSTDGTVAYLTQLGITRLVSGPSKNEGQPIFDIATLPLPGAETNPYIEVYPAGDRFRLYLAPTLRTVSGISAGAGASFTSAVVIEDTSLITPTPRPTPPPGAPGSISGAVRNGDGGISAPLVRSSSAGVADVPVYLSQLNAGTDTGTSRVTLTDSNGVYTFNNVPQGTYRISFDRADLAFLTPSLIVSTSEAIPDVAAVSVADQPSTCSAESRVQQIFAYSEAAQDLVTLANAQANKYLRLAKKFPKQKQQRIAATLDKLLEGVESNHAAFVASAELFPELVVSCQAGTTCVDTSFSTVASASSTSLRKLIKAVRAVVIRGARLLPGVQGANPQPVLERVGRKGAIANKRAKSLPTRSFVCPVETNPVVRE